MMPPAAPGTVAAMMAPAGFHHESPIDRAIREATERGEFDDLPGAGEPLPDTRGTDWWLRRYLETGDGANSGFLPPSLLLRREVEDLPERAARLRTEQGVRDLVTDLNRRIADEIRMPTWGPPLAMRPLDVDAVLDRWRADRRVLAERQAADLRAIQEARQAEHDRRKRRRGSGFLGRLAGRRGVSRANDRRGGRGGA